jgi:TorA maturation chaperone TorD
VNELDLARAEHYLLLGHLLREAPRAEIMSGLAQLMGDSSPLGMARIVLADAAKSAPLPAVGEEYFNIFVGVGRGEVLPYASFYLTGFLNERPLARVREDLARLGIERAADNFDPEDHLGTLFEIMAGLILGEFGEDADEQRVFFQRHIAPWAQRCIADVGVAPSAKFYRAVAGLARMFIEIETAAFEMS